MALHYDGFEQFIGDNSLRPALERAGYVVSGNVVTAAGRYGTAALSTDTGTVSRVHPWSGNTFVCGAAIRFAQRGAMMWVDAGEDRIMLWTDEETGNPHLNAARCDSIPVPVNFYYYEMEFDRAAGVVRLYVNGRPDGQAALPGNMGSAAELTVSFGFPSESTNGYPPAPTVRSTRFVDDLYINSGPRLGPVTVTTRMPGMDAPTREWSESEGSFHWSLINRRPPGLNNAYIVSDQMGATDLFYSHQQLISDKRIISTGVVVLARKSPEFVGRLRGIVGDNVNAAQRSSVVSVEDSWRTQYITFPENGSDTKEGIEAASFGVQVAE